jgi:hypothetical protein
MPIVTINDFLASKLHYLVIGGGTCGLVVAARYVPMVTTACIILIHCVTIPSLTENPDCVVGVIEAGEYHQSEPTVDVPGEFWFMCSLNFWSVTPTYTFYPAMMGHNICNPKYDWAFPTVPQKYVKNRSIMQSRGKGLGGSSMVCIP